jgi:tRNA threonylcarbamoyladenosine biosynthesis protein TsaE
LYRLKGVGEFLSMGFDEMFTAGGICCIEWSERIEEILPEGSLRIQLSHAEAGEEETTRHITVT